MVNLKTNWPSERCTSATVLHIIFGIFSWIFVFLPVILFASFPFALILFAHHAFARIFRPDLIPLGKAFDYILTLVPSKENPMGNGCQVWKLKGNMNISEFRTHFENLFLSTPELRESYRNLYCYFEKWGLYNFKRPVDSINLEEQITELKWDYEKYSNQSDTSDEEQLDMFIGKWMSTSNYGHTPNWRILLIQLEKTNESVLLFKMDHGLTDGYTMVHLIGKLSGVQAPYVVNDHNFTLTTKIKYILTAPTLIIKYAYKFLIFKPIPFPNHNSSEISALGQEWMVSFTTLDLKAVKKIRQLTKTHFNTVLGAIQVGALRRYCLESSKISEFPEVCFLPSPTGWPNHPAMTQATMQNHLTMTGICVPFKKDDCLNRLLVAEANYLYSVNVGLHIIVHWIFAELLKVSPPALMLLIIKFLTAIGVYGSTLSQGMSPLMMSGEKYQLLGLPVEHITLPVHIPLLFRPMHLMSVPTSNSGRLDISVNATKKIFKCQKDLDRFTKIYMQEELDRLIAAVVDSEKPSQTSNNN